MTAEEARFITMVHTHAARLYRYAFWICHDPDQSQNLVQKTFSRAWKSLSTLHTGVAEKTWLITILRCEHARIIEKTWSQQSSMNHEEITDLCQSCDTGTEAYVLRKTVHKLSRDFSEPLLLQVIYGHSCEEIASILDISKSAVMTRLFRVRTLMRSILTEDFEDRQEAIR